jgi:hypothetical protein
MKFPTIGITSPYTQGPFVRKAQNTLHDNSFGNFMGSARIDSQYGPLTGAAAHRARFWLGYPIRSCNKTYNDHLHQYLLGNRKLSAIMRARRKYRIAQSKKVTKNERMRKQLVAFAKAETGTKENPAGTNQVKYTVWYGMTGAWCAMYISWLLAVKLKVKFWRYAYVPYVVADSIKHKSKMFQVHPNDTMPGDLMCADWSRDGVYDHIGIVTSRMSGSEWSTNEGNTAIGNDSNGGEVMNRERSLADGRFVFIRLNFN